jgi:transcriptional regulator with XRE-family HTH domain
LNDFAKLLREERLAWDMGQDKIAKALGVSVSYYSAIETGRKPPSPAQFNAICRILKLDSKDQRRLQKAAADSVEQIRIDVSDYPLETRQMIFNFAWKVGSMSEFELRKLRDLVDHFGA